MARDLSTCVILPVSYPATRSYAEAVAITRGMDWFTSEQAAHVSFSRYKLFLLADDPESMIGSYLIHNYPGRVVGLSVSCDSVLVSRQLTAVKKGQLSHIMVPSKEDADSLGMATAKSWHLPVVPPAMCSVSVYGLSNQDPNWLRTITALAAFKEQFHFLSPDESIMETLWNFPVSFGVVPGDQHDRALIQSRVLIYSDSVESDRVVQKARAFGQIVIPTSQIAKRSHPVQEIRDTVEEHEKRAPTYPIREVFRGMDPDWEAPNNLQISSKEQPRMNKLLVKFPTRGRPKKFTDLLNTYVTSLSGRNQVTFLISIDEDDDSIDFDAFKDECERHNRKAHTRVRDDGKVERCDEPGSVTIQIERGLSANKIAAVNRDVEKAPAFDVVLLASDDMVPQVNGFDDVILQAMERYFPSTDGVLWFNDGYTGKKLNTLCCLGRAYYNRTGYIYHADYYSLWCDNEFMRVANMLGRQAYIDWTIIKHEHPANNAEIKSDSLYDTNDKWYKRDEGIFEKRQRTQFGGVTQRVLLSILIPTLTKRRNLRQALVKKIMDQLAELNAPGLIEFCISEDRGEKSIGQKRNELVSQAKGEYIIFLDDDDDVADNYAEALIANLADADVDCVTFGGLTVNKDGTSKAFVHSLRYPEYSETDRVYIRTPNHINAIRTTIARKHPFPATNFSEDHDFAQAIVKSGSITSEKFIPFLLYIYRPMPDGASSTFGSSLQQRPTAISREPNSGKGVVTQFQTGPVKKDEDPRVSKRRSAPRTRRTRRI